MANDVIGFIPQVGVSNRLNSLQTKDGQFIITTDDSKIYLDMDGKRQLIAEAKNNKNIIRGTFYLINWQYDSKNSIYYQTIEHSSISGNYPLMIDLVVSSSQQIGATEQDEWGKITRIVAGEGTLTAYCYSSQPFIDLNFQGKEV